MAARASEQQGVAPLQRWLFAFCRLRAVAPNTSASCELEVDADMVVARGGSADKSVLGSYTVLAELGDGTSIFGRLEVV